MGINIKEKGIRWLPIVIKEKEWKPDEGPLDKNSLQECHQAYKSSCKMNSCNGQTSSGDY